MRCRSGALAPRASRILCLAILPLVCLSILDIPGPSTKQHHVARSPAHNGTTMDAYAAECSLGTAQDVGAVSTPAHHDAAILAEPAPDAMEQLTNQCTVRGFVASTMAGGQEHMHDLDEQLLAVEGKQRDVLHAADELLRKADAMAADMQRLEDAKQAALSRGDFLAAAELQARQDGLQQAAMHLQSDSNCAYLNADELAELATGIKTVQVFQLDKLTDRLEALAAAAEAALRRLDAEAVSSLERANLIAGLAHAQQLGMHLRRQLQSLRNSVADVEDGALGKLQAAAEGVEQSRVVGQHLLEELARLHLQMRHANDLASSAQQFAADAAEQVQLALELQAYEHAASLTRAIPELQHAAELGQESSGLFDGKRKQTLEELKRHLEQHRAKQSSLQSAQLLLSEVRILRQVLEARVTEATVHEAAAQLSAIEQRMTAQEKLEQAN